MKDEQEKRNREIEMIYAYLKLTGWQRVKINTRMVWMLLTSSRAQRERGDLALIWSFVLHGVFPFFRPYLGLAALVLASLIVWAWAYMSAAGVLWLAAAALAAAALLQARPLFTAESDEIE